MKDLEPFELLKSDGVGACRGISEGGAVGLGIRLIASACFALCTDSRFPDAKAMKVAVEHDGMSLSDYEGSLLPDIEAALEELDDT